MKLSQDLKQKALDLGLCSEWTRQWGNPDKDELVDKYVRGIDFAIEHDFPSTDYMIRHFDGVMQEHGVYVSEMLNLKNPAMVVANGKCSGIVNYDKFAVGRMYVRHDTDITVVASGYSKLFISAYDNCKLTIVCKENAKVYVYQHGGEVDVTGDVLIRK